MQRLTAFQKLIATSIFTLLLVVLLGSMFWMLSSRVQGFSERLSEIEAKISSLEEERRRARALELVFEDRKLPLKRLESLLIPADKPVEFIESLEELARSTGNELSLDLASGASRKGVLSFRITVEGTAESSSRYLELLELMPYEIVVEELSLQRLNVADVISSGSSNQKRDERLTIVIAVKTL
jgi:hypothetical protein